MYTRWTKVLLSLYIGYLCVTKWARPKGSPSVKRQPERNGAWVTVNEDWVADCTADDSPSCKFSHDRFGLCTTRTVVPASVSRSNEGYFRQAPLRIQLYRLWSKYGRVSGPIKSHQRRFAQLNFVLRKLLTVLHNTDLALLKSRSFCLPLFFSHFHRGHTTTKSTWPSWYFSAHHY